jgi:hypothetical protein
MEASAAVGDFLFDDDRWVARYLVTEDRQHLHPPACAHLAHLLSRGGLAFAPLSPRPEEGAGQEQP